MWNIPTKTYDPKQVLDQLRFSLMYCKTLGEVDKAQAIAYGMVHYEDAVTNGQILKMCDARRVELKR